ncbi:alpha/beta hydrolase [Rhizobium sp. 1AS11]|uniref:alpha/beta fold hydrolase n=1 Tax=Rhizobium acaciae TaxID=2989736 RepID=UPI00221F06F7|nr:alpha/beta hydrolase [Rhizobium acaciae]MCW1409026.1 alpha/beta hydrolase [Rhizobium acaciae]MCW1741019.1 alpha/beta hydrolase [Rhizobium acaciae]MCW1749292.1 alpha/beta hydrolase [Rhizobium acaciae]
MRLMLTKQSVPPMLGTTIHVEDQDVHIIDGGNPHGIPVLLLHGCGSVAQEILFPFDNSDFRIIAPDRPGYGLSTPLVPAERGPEGQSFWLERLLASLDLPEVTIVAHSIGSAAALHLAARRPDLARGLFLISPCCAPVPSKPLIVLRSAVAPVVGPLIRQHVICRWPAFFLDRGLRSSSFPNPLPSHLSDLPASHVVNSITIRTMADELRAFNRDMERLPDLPGDLPLHVLFGMADRVISPNWHIDWLCRKHPAPIISLLEGVGHLPHHVVPGVARRMLGDLVEASAQETELPRVRSIGSQAVAEVPSPKEYMPVFRGDESPAL